MPSALPYRFAAATPAPHVVAMYIDGVGLALLALLLLASVAIR